MYFSNFEGRKNYQSYQKQKGRGTSDRSLFRLQVQKNFFIRYILSDQV